MEHTYFLIYTLDHVLELQQSTGAFGHLLSWSVSTLTALLGVPTPLEVEADTVIS